MPASVTAESADSLRRLTAAWRRKHPKRAFGGTWALTGFSFQAARYLFDFYDNLIRNQPLPTIEELSDIVCPADGGLIHVVQVKRTLTRETLKHSLAEFGEILGLIEADPPANGLKSLKFRVVCKCREANVAWPWPASVALPDELAALLPEIERRATDPFLVEQTDPLEDLLGSALAARRSGSAGRKRARRRQATRLFWPAGFSGGSPSRLSQVLRAGATTSRGTAHGEVDLRAGRHHGSERGEADKRGRWRWIRFQGITGRVLSKSAHAL